MSETAAPPAADPKVPPDPIVTKSYSVPIAIAMAAVVGAAVLTITDEMYLRRPYKKTQGQFQEVYSDYLARVEARRRSFLNDVLLPNSELKTLNDALAAAAAECAVPAGEIQAALTTAANKGRAITAATKDAKSEISALGYEAEHKAHDSGYHLVEEAPAAKHLLEEIRQVEERQVTFSWQAEKYDGVDEGGNPKFVRTTETETGAVKPLLAQALEIEVQKAALQQKLGKATEKKSEAAKAVATWIQDNLADFKHAAASATPEQRRKIADLGAAAFLDNDVIALAPDAIAGLKKALDDKIPHGTVTSLLRGDINQIHIAEAGNWVDRCETCHLNVRSPMPVTVEGIRNTLGNPGKVTVSSTPSSAEYADVPAWPASKLDAMPLELFKSHPNAALLAAHDPERFGCSMCHNGNGVAVTSVPLAHGTNHDWNWPLFPKEHIQAGCVQCHQQDLYLAGGDRINAGRDTFRRAGCWGCHKYEGFNTEVDKITALEGRRREIDGAKKTKALRIGNLAELCATLADDEAALAKEYPANKREQDALTQEIAALDTETADVIRRLRELYLERQRVGPNLKDVRVKLRPEFITDWIMNPREAHKDASGRAFRPDTKMPALRWWGDPEEEVKDVAAFLWQSTPNPEKFPEYRLPAFVRGDAKRGEELVQKRGCLVCHSIGTGDARIGADYAANLANLGEKNRPEYVARWITDPRRRLAAYDPTKPLGERDISGAAADDPNLVWAQHAIMPNFRLTPDEVRDITTFLTDQRREGVKYESAPWLDDTSRFERGKKLVVFQGCAGCHEIAGLEDEKGIGTELTKEGSKPLDQLDFGHHTINAERSIEPLKDGKGLLQDTAKLFTEDKKWYRPLGFFLHKIAKPDIYDDAKNLPDRFSRLRMPQFDFTAQELTDVATVVVGSVETKIPRSFRYEPDAAGRAIREGWWVVKKYNCQGCHQVLPTDVPALWKTPLFADKTEKLRDSFLPPTLVGVGFRLTPEFLGHFLRDPSLGGGRAKPASVRAHLDVRMPTFEFSDDEIQKLVLFFGALSKQPLVYQARALEPLSPAEMKAAKAIWASANCMQCHVVDGMATNAETKAPNLNRAPGRLRPDWTRRWIANPPAMNPATAMTKNFGDAPRSDGRWHYMKDLPELGGISADHVDLMTRFVLLGHASK